MGHLVEQPAGIAGVGALGAKLDEAVEEEGIGEEDEAVETGMEELAGGEPFPVDARLQEVREVGGASTPPATRHLLWRAKIPLFFTNSSTQKIRSYVHHPPSHIHLSVITHLSLNE